jgi:small subunit ribosomal protein S17
MMAMPQGAPVGGAPSSHDGPTSGSAETARQAAGRRARKSRVGTVVSDKMQKTVVVAIERRVAHPTYGKMMTRTTRLKAHDEQNASKAGDTVRIVETRPLSKDKRWRVVEILERAR